MGMEGYLQKLGSSKVRRNRRFFRIVGFELRYWKGRPSDVRDVPCRAFDLRKCQVESSKDALRFVLKIRHEVVLDLKANDQDDFSSWKKSLNVIVREKEEEEEDEHNDEKGEEKILLQEKHSFPTSFASPEQTSDKDINIVEECFLTRATVAFGMSQSKKISYVKDFGGAMQICKTMHRYPKHRNIQIQGLKTISIFKDCGMSTMREFLKEGGLLIVVKALHHFCEKKDPVFMSAANLTLNALSEVVCAHSEAAFLQIQSFLLEISKSGTDHTCETVLHFFSDMIGKNPSSSPQGFIKGGILEFSFRFLETHMTRVDLVVNLWVSLLCRKCETIIIKEKILDALNVLRKNLEKIDFSCSVLMVIRSALLGCSSEQRKKMLKQQDILNAALACLYTHKTHTNVTSVCNDILKLLFSYSPSKSSESIRNVRDESHHDRGASLYTTAVLNLLTLRERSCDILLTEGPVLLALDILKNQSNDSDRVIHFLGTWCSSAKREILK